jgi:hypothetical protein
MMTAEDRIARVEARLVGIEGCASRIDCALEQVNKRFNDMIKLLLAAVAIYGAGLITGLVGIALQLAT